MFFKLAQISPDNYFFIFFISLYGTVRVKGKAKQPMTSQVLFQQHTPRWFLFVCFVTIEHRLHIAKLATTQTMPMEIPAHMVHMYGYANHSSHTNIL